MNLKRICLRNFKPFYETNSVYLENGSGVTLFGAKNDRGKTALLESVRFCLYDFESDDSGSRREKRNRCINRKAVVEDSDETFVSLIFEHNDRVYTIKRVLEFSRVDNRTARETDNHYVTVEIEDKDDYFIDTREDDEITDYREFRDGILPESASHFFIFDGEMIDRYAQRFGKRNTDVRKAIELVLGIEEIRKAVSDLQEYGVNYYRNLFQEAQSEAEEYREKKDQLDQQRSELSSLRTKLEEKEEEIEFKQEKKNDVEERLAEAGEVQAKYQRLLKTRAELYGPEHEIAEKARDHFDEEELDDLTPSIKQQLHDTRNERQDVYQKFGPVAGVLLAREIESTVALDSPGGLVEVLQKTLDELPENCYVCDRSLENISREELVNKLQEITHELTEEARYIYQLAENLIEFTEGNDEYDSGHQKAQFEHLTRRISELSQDVSKRESRIERLEEVIQNAEFGTDEVDEIRDRLEELKRQESRLKIEIENLQDDIDEQAELVGELKSELNELEGATAEEERYNRLIEVSKQARDTFEVAKHRYVEQRRESVEERASQLFMDMTNKDDVYEGLSIHSDYQLRIKTSDGTFTIADQDPSRGARQTIAYAFIAGLAQFSSRNAPILIDTPIARLDPGHKANLIENLPKFVDQIVVFYQPNELTEEDIDLIRESGEIVAHYDIIQGEDPRVSKIIEHDRSHFQSPLTSND